MTTEFERVLIRRGIWSNSRVWYTSQKASQREKLDFHLVAEFVS